MSSIDWTRQIIGSVIERYEILRLIGIGGTAAVFEGRHQVIGRRVAIKILRPEYTASRDIRERFVKEAQLMAGLSHPGIPEIFTFEDQPKRLSIIMEYLEGEDLKSRMDRVGPLAKDDIIQIFDQILTVLQYVHENGIVLRDIKPSNIFLLHGNQIKILDFGIAKRFGEGDGYDATTFGNIMGTPIYMSPEQVEGNRSIDHRSDIYSLGITLYTACHGKPPYDKSKLSDFQIFKMIVSEELPDLTTDSFYRHLISKACQKNREHRFQSCDEWRTQLHHPVFEEMPIPEAPPPPELLLPPAPPKKSWLYYSLVALPVIALITIIYTLAFGSTDAIDTTIYDIVENKSLPIEQPVPKKELRYNYFVHTRYGAPVDTSIQVQVKVWIDQDGNYKDHEILDEYTTFPNRKDYGIRDEIKFALQNSGIWHPAYKDQDSTKRVSCKFKIQFDFGKSE